MSFFKFQLFAGMTSGFKEAAKQQGAGSGAELDEVKRMFIETNPWFLGLTGLVSMLHVVYVYTLNHLRLTHVGANLCPDLRCLRSSRTYLTGVKRRKWSGCLSGEKFLISSSAN